MANTKIKPRQRLLFLGEVDPADATLVCITQIQTSESANDINADSFCGNDSLPGTKTASITCACQIIEGTSAGKVSYKKIHDWYNDQTALFFKIARAVPTAGDIENTGACFVQQITTTDDLNAVSTFNITLKVDGDVTVYNYLRDITLATVAVGAGDITQGTEKKAYSVSIDTNGNEVVIDTASIVLNGTFDPDDLDAVKVSWNDSDSLSGATVLETQALGLNPGATLTFGPLTIPDTATHILFSVVADAAATVDNTIIADAPIITCNDEFNVTDNITGVGGTLTIILN